LFEKFRDRNFTVLSVITVLLFAILLKLFSMQIVNGKEYLAQSINKLTNSVEVPAPRGVIYDRNGRPLITNRVGFSVQVVYSSMPQDKLNDILLKTVEVLKANGDTPVDTFPVSEKFKFIYKTDDTKTAKEKTLEFKKKYDIPSSADGKQTVKKLAKKYGVDDRYSYKEMRTIVAMRYELETRGLGYGSPVTIASDVSMESVSVLKENSAYYSNINVVTSPFREYVYGDLAAHVLGRVGVIYQEEYEKLKEQDYGMNDIIGKDGLEKFLEPYIKGTDGRINLQRNIGTDALSPDEISAIPGNDAVLTIDYDLQKIAEDALEETIANIKQKGAASADKAGADAGGGAVVAIDVRTGEILAIASYPDFYPATFDEDYDKLIKDEGKPMFNRAISGTYEPGSVFKVLTAIAALEEKVITTEETVLDKGRYEHYGQFFNCWVWTQKHETHGLQNVSDALGNSCNYYFYEVGKRLGEKKIYEYAKQVGLGSTTGIEIEGEASGVLANEDYKMEVFDQIWYPGDTLQMAIGQSFNVFTPIQIANYIATVANGGTRYKPHLTKGIRDSSKGGMIKEFEPEVIGEIKMSDSTYEAVTRGMFYGSKEGTSSAVFADFPINVCSKTGSAQVSKGSANGVFASYAPYENPQIAVVVVIENAGAGSSLAPIARKIYEKYFDLYPDYAPDKKDRKNTLSE